MTEYKPGTYVKGDEERVAKNARQAVALVFDGFKLKETDQVEAPVADDKTEDLDSLADAPTPVDAAPKPQAPKPSAPKETRKP